MAGPDEKDEALKTPPVGGQRTTPFGSGASEATTELDLADPALRPLAQRYDLLAEVGRGGMGIIYRARDRETGDVLALKILNPEIASRPELIERFTAELLLARKITHKNICRVHDLNRFGSVAAISMEYIEGENLRSLLQRVEGLSVRHGLKIIRQVLAGVGEAHAQGVVHRDLKPENILLARDGTVKVMDFGIARSLESDTTKTGSVIGTPAYMSPEQVEGKPADARSDIYALGLILYEMFTGQPAFRAETPVAVALKRVHETPPPPRQLEPDLPDRIDRAITKCLEKNPKKRFQSVKELEAALTKKAEARPAVAEGEEVPLPLHLTRWQRSDWLLVGAAVVGLALFFPSFERTSLAPRSPVAFDRGALPRIAQEYAQRLGAPVGRDYRIGVIPAPRRYEYLATTAGAPVALELANNPVPYWGWSVDWQHADRQPTVVLVDNHGSLVTFIRDFPSGSGSERIPLEEAQELASKALRDFFNREASQLLSSSAGPDTWRGFPAYTFRWEEPTDFHGMKRGYVVRLVGREVAHLLRFYEPPAGYVWQYPFWQILPMLLLGVVLLVLGLYQRAQVDPAARWRTVMTALYFTLGIWLSVAGRMPWEESSDDFTLLIFLSTILGVAVAFAWFFESIALERAVRRVAPARFAGFVRFFDRRILSEPCGLALLRGAFFGLALLGLDTVLVSTGTSKLGMRLDSFTQVLWQAWPYLRTSWPNVHLVSDALVQTFTIGIPIAFLASFLGGLVRRSWVTLFGGAALAAVFIVNPLITLGAVQPYHWKVALLFVDCLLLAWAFTRFDLLTLLAAVFTFAFWWQNYHLLVMFEPTGAGDQWLAFAVWGLVVLAAAGIAFQAALKSAYRRVAAAFE